MFGRFLITGIDDRKNLLFSHLKAKESLQGSLVYIDVENKTWGNIKMLKFPENLPFHPHGIFLYDNSTLYVINHGYGNYGERIEVFSISGHEKLNVIAKYLRSIIFEKEFLGKLNDVAVINDQNFYVTE